MAFGDLVLSRVGTGNYTIRNPSTGILEDPFRTCVRELLGFHWDARDEQIFEELRILKRDVIRRDRRVS